MCKYPNIHVKLEGEDGNSYAIMGRVTSALKEGLRGKMDPKDIQLECANYLADAMSDDRDNLLCVTMDWVNCDDMEDPYYEYVDGDEGYDYDPEDDSSMYIGNDEEDIDFLDGAFYEEYDSEKDEEDLLKLMEEEWVRRQDQLEGESKLPKPITMGNLLKEKSKW